MTFLLHVLSHRSGGLASIEGDLLTAPVMGVNDIAGSDTGLPVVPWTPSVTSRIKTLLAVNSATPE
jgi:hypothetical protein